MTTAIEKNPLSEISATEATEIAKKELTPEPIVREVGEAVAFSDGKDYDNVRIRVVPNMHKRAADHEKWLYINQGPKMGLSLSLESIEKIVKWAKEKRENGKQNIENKGSNSA